jgi:hypothetical protein
MFASTSSSSRSHLTNITASLIKNNIEKNENNYEYKYNNCSRGRSSSRRNSNSDNNNYRVTKASSSSSSSSSEQQKQKQIVPSGKFDRNGIIPCLGPGMCNWPDAWNYLAKQKKMETIDARTCMKMIKNKNVQQQALIIDCRFEPDFEQWSIPGSVNVPYVHGGFLAKLRLPGFKKKNLDFVNDVRRLEPNLNRKIILVDIWGGSLFKEPPSNRGLTDDTKGAGSLPAAFELYQVGYTKLYHLSGGVNQYYEDAYYYPNELPEPPVDKKWPGDLEWFGYRQFNGKDRARGQRDD